MWNNTSVIELYYDKCHNGSEQNSLNDLRYYMVAYGGIALSCMSILENLFLFTFLLSKQQFRNSNFLYLAIIAICDFIQGFCYISAMPISIIFERYGMLWLARVWYVYILQVWVVSHIILPSIAFLLVAASFERFMAIKRAVAWTVRQRLAAAAVAFCLAFVSKGTIYFEFEIVREPVCQGTLSEYQLRETPFVSENPSYAIFWCFWYRQIFDYFLPCGLLLLFNFVVVRHYLMTENNATKRKQSCTVRYDGLSYDEEQQAFQLLSTWVGKARTRVRKSATRTLMVIVIEYLISSGLALFVAAWEFADINSLVTCEPFYTISTDVISLLVVLDGVIRLPTCYICDTTFRRELKTVVRTLLTKVHILNPAVVRRMTYELSPKGNNPQKSALLTNYSCRQLINALRAAEKGEIPEQNVDIRALFSRSQAVPENPAKKSLARLIIEYGRREDEQARIEEERRIKEECSNFFSQKLQEPSLHQSRGKIFKKTMSNGVISNLPVDVRKTSCDVKKPTKLFWRKYSLQKASENTKKAVVTSENSKKQCLATMGQPVIVDSLSEDTELCEFAAHNPLQDVIHFESQH